MITLRVVTRATNAVSQRVGGPKDERLSDRSEQPGAMRR